MRHFRITVDGTAYDVSVEELDEIATPAPTASVSPPATPVTPRHPSAEAARPAPAPPPVAPQGNADGTVASPLAGTVVSIEVIIGQHVTTGQQLLVLEAMKMNTHISAPRDGQVVAINVTPGTAVAEGQALLAIG